MKKLFSFTFIIITLSFCIVILNSCGGAKTTGERIFRFRLANDPPTLDPIHSTDTISATIVFRIFEGLVDQDPVNLDIVPSLAENWEISPDGLTYTFHLKKGIKFHNGREVKSDDFRWSFERCLNPTNRSERMWILLPIKGAEDIKNGLTDTLSGLDTPDDYTVIITLEKPFAPFLSYLCMESARAIAKESISGDRFTPIGTGPYKFLYWQHDIRVSIGAFEEYHGEIAKIKLVDYEIIPDVGVAFQKFGTGELDFVNEVPPGQLELVKERYPEQLKVWPFLRNEYIGFNHTRPPFKGNLKLRQALCWAVDRQSIADKIFEGAAIPGNCVLPPGIPGRDETIEGYGFDLDKASKLLAEAGYPEGKGLPEITLWYNNNETHQQVVEFVQSTFAEIGVKSRLKSLDWAAYLKACDNLEPDMYRLGWVADIPDADNFLYILLHSAQKGAPGNYSGYSNPEFDKLVEEARVTLDQDKRIELYKKADRIATEDACWIHLMYSMERVLFNTDYEGLILPEQGDFRIPIDKLSYKGKTG